jgi:MbtH protein
MANPFDDDERDFLVLVDMAERYSLWPADIDVPEGWTVAFGAAAREECLRFVEEHWSALRPSRLGRGTTG